MPFDPASESAEVEPTKRLVFQFNPKEPLYESGRTEHQDQHCRGIEKDTRAYLIRYQAAGVRRNGRSPHVANWSLNRTCSFTALATAALSFSSSTGLTRYSTTPFLNGSVAPLMAGCPVRMIIGTEGNWDRK